MLLLYVAKYNALLSVTQQQ